MDFLIAHALLIVCHSLFEVVIEQITNSGKTVAVAPFTVHTIVDGDKAHIVAGENDIRVLTNSQIISAKPAEIFLCQVGTKKF